MINSTPISKKSSASAVWRPEGGRIAIQVSPFILERLRSLNREVVYSPYVFTAILVDQEDRDMVEKVRGTLLYPKGTLGIKFVEA